MRELDADIIGLQEVLADEDGSDNDAEKIANALGYSWFYAPTQLLTPSASYVLSQLGVKKNKWWGNALLSRYPMSSKRVHVLSEERKRTALEGAVAVGGTSLHVFSTHLVHGGGRTAEAREAQVDRLLAFVPSTAAIVMGDFNATPESGAVQKMNRIMTQTESDLSRATIGRHPELYRAADGATDEQRLDYIFITSDLRAVESGIADSDASDHIPVYALVELP